MITAGVDIGAKTVKVVLARDGHNIGQAMDAAGYDVQESFNSVWNDALKKAGIRNEEVERIVATGTGRLTVRDATDTVTEVSAAAKGAIALDKSVRTVIDVGAEEGRAIRIDQNGKVVDFAINEKCAAGAGAFTEAMARALEVQIHELGPLSLKSTQAVAMNAQCAVFAESELVTLVHSKTPKPDMARSVHNAIADRIVSMVRRVGMEPEVMLIGGVARNIGFVKSLNEGLQLEVKIPEEPEMVSAFGAALIAAGM